MVVESVRGFAESFGGLYQDQVLYAKICPQYPEFVSEEDAEDRRTTASIQSAPPAVDSSHQWRGGAVGDDGAMTPWRLA